MSAVLSKALREDVLALAKDKRESTTASVEFMLKQHLKKAVSRRKKTVSGVVVKRITSKAAENLTI